MATFNWGNIFDPNAVKENMVAALRAQAKQQNDLHLALYMQASKDWVETNIGNRDKGLTVQPAPVAPKQIQVTEAGEWLEVEWAGLPVPSLPPVPPQSNNSLRPPNAPPSNEEMLGAIMAAIMQLDSKVDRLMVAGGVK